MAVLRMGHGSNWLRWPRRKWRVVEVVDAAYDIPERIPRRGAVIVGTPEKPTWIAFDCPCSERHRVMLNTDVRRRPTWSVKTTKALTLAPSVDETRGTKRCHYVIRNGNVRWVRYNGWVGSNK